MSRSESECLAGVSVLGIARASSSAIIRLRDLRDLYVMRLVLCISVRAWIAELRVSLISDGSSRGRLRGKMRRMRSIANICKDTVRAR